MSDRAWIDRLGDPVMATVTLTCADGEQITQEQRLSHERPAWMDDPPGYLVNLRKRWDHPQEPLAFTADVQPGHEQEARELLA